MRTWVIADIQSLEILTTYRSDFSQQSTYGGPWGDTSKTVHLPVPQDLENKKIQVLALESTELQDEEGDTIVDLSPGPTQVAHDSQGRIILNELGKPTLVSSWEWRPRMGAALKVVLK